MTEKRILNTGASQGPELFKDASFNSQNPVTNLTKIIKKASGRQLKHPGLYYLLDLYLQITVLEEFMDGAEKSILYPEILPELLPWISDHINSAYEYDEDSRTRKNGFLLFGTAQNNDVFGELESPEWSDLYRRKIEDDIITHTSLTMKDVRELREKITKLVNRRSGIFAALEALANCMKQDEISGERAAVALSGLLWLWSGFKKELAELRKSERLTNAFVAARENIVQLQNDSTKRIKFNHLPAKIYLRWQDYEKGRGGFAVTAKNWQGDSKSISIEDIPEGKCSVSATDSVVKKAEISLAYSRANSVEKTAMEKILRKESLSDAERQAIHRLPKKLKKLTTKSRKFSKPPLK